MDDMHRLIEKYKRELMEYSKAAAPQKPLDFPEMIPDTADAQTKQGAASVETQTVQPSPNPIPEPMTAPEPVSESAPAPMPVREPAPAPVSEPAPAPMLFREPAPKAVSESAPAPMPVREPAPTPAAEPVPESEPVHESTELEPESVYYDDPDSAPRVENRDSSTGDGKRKPEIIGYVGSDDALGEYGNIFSDLIPRTGTNNAKTESTQYDLPSQRENSDNNTSNSIPDENVLFSGEISGVTDNTPSQPPPELTDALEVSPERAEGLSKQPISGTSPEEQLTGRSFEDGSPAARSRDDIKPINSGAVLIYKEQEYSSYDDFSEKNPSTGLLRFLVFTARSALPVKGAVCKISKNINGSVLTMFSLVTDESGQTPIVYLPTRPKSESQTPSEDGVPPYAVYDAIVSAEGFDNVIYKNIPIFSGILSVQRVAMIPSSDVSEQQSENNGGV